MINEGKEVEYGIMDFGFEIHEIINPNYAKMIFKLNSAGNLTIEAFPSFTPGVKPEGTQHGKVPAGTRVFDYEKKIIVSLGYMDCVNIVHMFDEPNINLPLKLYRNSIKFNKTITISCQESADSTPNDVKYYYTINFDSTTSDGANIKFKLPMSSVIFEEFAEILRSYTNNYHMIKYYNQVEKAKTEKIKKELDEIKSLVNKLITYVSKDKNYSDEQTQPIKKYNI